MYFLHLVKLVRKRQKVKYLSSPLLSSYTCLINFEEANFMNDKHDIVPLTDKTKFPKRNSRNTLMLSIKNKDLELNFYSSLNSKIMTEILEKVLP